MGYLLRRTSGNDCTNTLQRSSVDILNFMKPVYCTSSSLLILSKRAMLRSPNFTMADNVWTRWLSSMPERTVSPTEASKASYTTTASSSNLEKFRRKLPIKAVRSMTVSLDSDYLTLYWANLMTQASGASPTFTRSTAYFFRSTSRAARGDSRALRP